jgi:tetratricopeptide (TPR) repeat protein
LAIESASEEKKNNPNLADPYILAAEVYSSLRDYQKCATEYQQALRLRPQGADIYVRISKCYRLSGNLDVAENMLNIAASQESGFAEIYKEQGAIYEQKGDRRAAAQAYTKYLALSPNAPDRKEIESRISLLASGQ